MAEIRNGYKMLDRKPKDHLRDFGIHVSILKLMRNWILG
jgi:hypothetical protein